MVAVVVVNLAMVANLVEVEMEGDLDTVYLAMVEVVVKVLVV